MKSFVLSMVLSVVFLVLSVMAMRRRRLREQTALLWLLVCFVMVFLSAVLPTHLLDSISRLVGIAYSPTLILLLAVLFLMGLVFHLSLRLDRLSASQIVLVQELGLLTATPPPSLEEGHKESPERTGEGSSSMSRGGGTRRRGTASDSVG